MPPTARHATTESALAPVPVAVLLPSRATSPPASHGLSGSTAHRLIATYTRPGDLVIDLDATATLAAAAHWLDRRTATTVTHSHHHPVSEGGSGGRTNRHRDGAGLIVVNLLHVVGTDHLGLHPLTDQIRSWSAALRPGGFLAVVLSAERRDQGLADHATTVITAARAAALSYHQHLIDVLTPLPDDEPRARAEHAAASRPNLLAGRHTRAHRDVFVFARPKEAGNA